MIQVLIEATRQITVQQPDMRVLVKTSFIWDEKIIPAIKAGAVGFVMKESGPGELTQSIYKGHQGELAFHPSIALKLSVDEKKSSFWRSL